MDGVVGNLAAKRLYLKWKVAIIGTEQMYLYECPRKVLIKTYTP